MIEVWIENETMVEILPPEFAREYLAFTRPETPRFDETWIQRAPYIHPMGMALLPSGKSAASLN